MKIRSLLPILVLAAQTATATTFKLPKNAPLFSIEMPENWLTEEKGDVVTSRAAKDSKTVVSVFPVPAAKNLEDAFNIASKQTAALYQDYSVGQPSEATEAGMIVRMAGGKGKQGGAEIRIFLVTFSPDDQRYFAVTQAVDHGSMEKYASELSRVVESIKSLKEEARKAKEAHDKATSVVPFPKDRPAFTMEIPNGFVTDATAERLVIKTRKERKSFFHLAAIPAGDGVADEASAKAWLPKKALALLTALGGKDLESREVEESFSNVAGYKAFETKHDGDLVDELKLWVFTPDGKRYFYAYFQRMMDEMDEIIADADADVFSSWSFDLLKSIKPAK